jgi:hypothetical protein
MTYHVKCFYEERSVLPVYGDEYYGGVSGSGGCALVSMEGGSLISWNSGFVSIAYCSWINNCIRRCGILYLFYLIMGKESINIVFIFIKLSYSIFFVDDQF